MQRPGVAGSQIPGNSLIGRTLKLIFPINESCLAKERCIPEIDNSEEIIQYMPEEQFF
jgi:hypothetical protein